MSFYWIDDPQEGSAEWVAEVGLRGILRHAVKRGVMTVVTPDDETMWCFRHSEETKGPEGVQCYKQGYKGQCDVGLAHIFRDATQDA